MYSLSLSSVQGDSMLILATSENELNSSKDKLNYFPM